MERLRIGVVGVGWQGGKHLSDLTAVPQAELTAICDLNQELLAQRQAEYDVPHAFTDYRELVASEQVDAVILVLPDFLHREGAVAALEAGKHLLLEKPMAVTVEDAQAIVEAAEAAPGRFMLNLSNRWMPSFATAKARLDEGDYGGVRYVWARLSNRREVPTVRLPWLQDSHLAHWIGVHRLDIARWYIGAEPVRVRAVHRKNLLQSQGFDTIDFYQATIEFEGGAVVNLEGSWILPDGYPSLVDSRFYCLCDHGVIDVDRMRTELNLAGMERNEVSAGGATLVDREGGFTVEASRHFVDCCLAGKDPLIGPRDGLALTRTLCAVVESCERDGEVVELD